MATFKIWDGAAWQYVSLASGATAVSGATANLITPVFNVRDSAYGATGDGVTDDTAALDNAAAAAATAGGGTIYLPPGTYLYKPVGTTGWWGIPSNTTVKGAGNKRAIVKTHPLSGNYQRMVGNRADGHVTSVVIEDLGFDQNPSGNTTYNVNTSSEANHNRVIYFSDFDGVWINRCRFDPCIGVQTVLLSQAHGGPGWATNNDFVWQRGPTTATDNTGAVAYDNSALYCEVPHFLLANNRFYAAVGQRAYGAMEANIGPGIVTGNVVDGFATLCHVSSQESGEGTQTVSNGIAVTGNTQINGTTGIRLWPYTGYTLRNVTVTGNTIHLAQIDTNETRACGLEIVVLSDGTLSGAVENVLFADNTILFQEGDTRATARNSTALSSITNYGIGVGSYATMKGVVVKNNLVRGAPFYGIKVGAAGGATASQVTVSGNVFIDCGQNPNGPDGTFGQLVMVLDGALTDVLLEHNVIRDTGSPNLKGKYWFYNGGQTSGTRVRLRDNLVTQASATALQASFSGTKALVNDGFAKVSHAVATLAANTSDSVFTIACYGATTSDVVNVTVDGGLAAGLIVEAAWISAADTVSVRVRNVSSGSITGATYVFRCRAVSPQLDV